jgi:sortase A
MIQMLTKKVMAFLIVPLLFALLGYTIFYFSLKPAADFSISLVTSMISEALPDFSGEENPLYEDVNLIERNSVPLSEVVIPYIGQHFAQMNFPDIDFSVKVYFGDNDRILRRGAGMYAGSQLPGFKRTTLIAGHSWTVLNAVQHAKLDDVIEVKTNYGLYVYQIFDIVLAEDDFDSYVDLKQTEEDILVVYTCYPFQRMVGRLSIRYFIYARRISGPDILRGD